MVVFITAPISGLFREETTIPHEWKQGETQNNLVRWYFKPNILYCPTHWRVWIKFNIADHERDPDNIYPAESTLDPNEPGYWTSFSFPYDAEPIMTRAQRWEIEQLHMESIIELTITINQEDLMVTFDVYQSSWTIRRPAQLLPTQSPHIVSGRGPPIADF